MRRLMVAVLYTALALGANAGMADVPAARAVAAGDMRKLQIHDVPAAVPEGALLDLADAPRSLAEWRGGWVLVNFWATWCAPCRKEMPGLARLAKTGDIAVVTVATGRNPPEAIDRFMTEIGVSDLTVLRDPTSALARTMGILGLPMTVVLDPEGREAARLIGDADWDGTDAAAALAALRN